MKSLKTTIAGLIAGLPIVIDALSTAYTSGQFEGKTGMQLVFGIGLVLLGCYSKDHNVSGK